MLLIPSSKAGGDGNEPKPTGHLPVSGSPSQARVLIVEDEWLVSTDMETTLQKQGYQVVGIAASADEAVRMAEAHRPDIVLMDIRLNGRRDGVDAAIEINRRWGLRCLFVSAYTDQKMMARGKAANPFGWLSKPFSARQLVDALKAALRNLPN